MPFRQLFEEAIAEGAADGSIGAGIDSGATAAGLVALVRGIAMQWQVASELVPLHGVRRTVHQVLDVGLRGRSRDAGRFSSRSLIAGPPAVPVLPRTTVALGPAATAARPHRTPHETAPAQPARRG